MNQPKATAPIPPAEPPAIIDYIAWHGRRWDVTHYKVFTGPSPMYLDGRIVTHTLLIKPDDLNPDRWMWHYWIDSEYIDNVYNQDDPTNLPGVFPFPPPDRPI